MSRTTFAAVAAGILLVGCSSAAQSSTPSPAPNVIEIAADFPLSGPYATSGAETIAGAQFAVEQTRMIGRYRLIFRAFDNTLAGFQDPAKGVEDVAWMTEDPRVVGMIGPFNSSEAAAEIPVASQDDLAMISPSATADCLTLLGPGCARPDRPGGVNNFFRLAAFDSEQGRAMADFANKQLGLTRVAVFSDGHPYGEELATSFSAELPLLGGLVVLREVLQPSTYDYSDLLQRIKATGAQAIYFGGAPSNGVCRIRSQMQAMLAGAYFLGGDALLDKSCVADAQSGANPLMIATVAEGRPLPDAEATQVVAAFSRTHRSIGGYTFAAYDAAEILIDAIRRAIDADGGKFPSRLQVVKQMGATSFAGITGHWSFDMNGDATAPSIAFYRIEQGKWTYWQSGALREAS